MLRTTDAGTTWNPVGSSGIAHGGGSTYYTSEGVLYTGGFPSNQRSTDNGETWTTLDLPGDTTCIFGDGEHLWTKPIYGDGPLLVAPETGPDAGTNWTPFNEQTFPDGGPYEMVLDPVNRVLYASLWFQGVWALKLAD
jgi:hypothetical protein